jgi:hypothetical protein
MPATENQRVVVVTGASRGLGVGGFSRDSVDSRVHLFQLEWVRQYRETQNTYVIAIVRSTKKESRLFELADDKRVAIIEADIGRAETFEVSPSIKLGLLSEF